MLRAIIANRAGGWRRITAQRARLTKPAGPEPGTLAFGQPGAARRTPGLRREQQRPSVANQAGGRLESGSSASLPLRTTSGHVCFGSRVTALVAEQQSDVLPASRCSWAGACVRSRRSGRSSSSQGTRPAGAAPTVQSRSDVRTHERLLAGEPRDASKRSAARIDRPEPRREQSLVAQADSSAQLGKQVRRSRGPRRARSFHSESASRRCRAAASARSLAGSLQASRRARARVPRTAEPEPACRRGPPRRHKRARCASETDRSDRRSGR
jgi:hypothetical protein